MLVIQEYANLKSFKKELEKYLKKCALEGKYIPLEYNTKCFTDNAMEYILDYYVNDIHDNIVFDIENICYIYSEFDTFKEVAKYYSFDEIFSKENIPFYYKGNTVFNQEEFVNYILNNYDSHILELEKTFLVLNMERVNDKITTVE